MTDNSQNSSALIRRNCWLCGVAFWSERSTAEYCTPAHKQKAYRWRHKVTKLKSRAVKCITELAIYLEYEVSTESAVLALSDIKGSIADVLLQNKVKEVK